MERKKKQFIFAPSLQIIELPEQGLDTLMVVDLNLNKNELGYLGESLAKAPRLKVIRQKCIFLPTNP